MQRKLYAICSRLCPVILCMEFLCSWDHYTLSLFDNASKEKPVQNQVWIPSIWLQSDETCLLRFLWHRAYIAQELSTTSHEGKMHILNALLLNGSWSSQAARWNYLQIQCSIILGCWGDCCCELALSQPQSQQRYIYIYELNWIIVPRTFLWLLWFLADWHSSGNNVTSWSELSVKLRKN